MRMKCKDLDSLLGPHVFGELERDQAAQVEAHLTVCPRCREEFAGMRHAVDVLKTEFSDEEAPVLSDERRRALAGLRSTAPEPRRGASPALFLLRFHRHPAAKACVQVAAVLVGLGIISIFLIPGLLSPRFDARSGSVSEKCANQTLDLTDGPHPDALPGAGGDSYSRSALKYEEIEEEPAMEDTERDAKARFVYDDDDREARRREGYAESLFDGGRPGNVSGRTTSEEDMRRKAEPGLTFTPAVPDIPTDPDPAMPGPAPRRSQPDRPATSKPKPSPTPPRPAEEPPPADEVVLDFEKTKEANGSDASHRDTDGDGLGHGYGLDVAGVAPQKTVDKEYWSGVAGQQYHKGFSGDGSLSTAVHDVGTGTVQTELRGHGDEARRGGTSGLLRPETEAEAGQRGLGPTTVLVPSPPRVSGRPGTVEGRSGEIGDVGGRLDETAGKSTGEAIEDTNFFATTLDKASPGTAPVPEPGLPSRETLGEWPQAKQSPKGAEDASPRQDVLNLNQLEQNRKEGLDRLAELERFVAEDLRTDDDFEGGVEEGSIALRSDAPALLDSVGPALISQAGASDAAAAVKLTDSDISRNRESKSAGGGFLIGWGKKRGEKRMPNATAALEAEWSYAEGDDGVTVHALSKSGKDTLLREEYKPASADELDQLAKNLLAETTSSEDPAEAGENSEQETQLRDGGDGTDPAARVTSRLTEPADGPEDEDRQVATAVTAGRSLEDKLDTIILSRLECEEATITDVAQYLRDKSRELDPEGKGVSIVLRNVPENEAAGVTAEAAANQWDGKVTIAATDVPVGEAIRYMCESAGYEYRVVGDQIVIKGKPSLTEETTEDGWEAPQEARFKLVPVNPFILSERDRFSTFSLDTDTASYALAGHYIRHGQLPPAGAIRMEEFVNAFDYNYVRGDGVFNVFAEGADSPFGKDLKLVKIGVQGRIVGREGRKPAHFVFLIDTSGSMARSDRMPLVLYAMELLLDQLGERDRISMVTYGAKPRLVLDYAPSGQTGEIVKTLSSIQCGGSTNLFSGVKLAYQIAARRYQAGAINRIILLSDGATNVGPVNAEELLDQVSEFRRQGINFFSIGFGMGNYNDEILEALANKGDGNYLFVASRAEARRALVEQMSATVQYIAKDAKIQVEFNPRRVRRYRLIGYENRDIADKDFRNDAIDAGEVGSGQSATALYEVELLPDTDTEVRPDLGTVYVRYRDLATDSVEEISIRLDDDILRQRKPEDSPRFYLAACVAEFAELLRQSEHARDGSYADVRFLLEKVAAKLPLDGQVRQLLVLVRKAQSLAGDQRLSQP